MSILADNKKMGTDEFYEKFTEFVKVLEQLQFINDYLIVEHANTTCTVYQTLSQCKIYNF